jgi:hypothetical protein
LNHLKVGRVRVPGMLVLTCWIVLVTAVSIVLRLRAPAWLWADFGHDDELFARSAGAILDGRWLGDFDQLTLAKGPGYPIFMTFAYEARLPLKLAEHFVHLLAGAAAALAVWRVTRSRVAGVLCYSVIALDPAYLGATASRVSRDGTYASFSLLLVAGVVLFLTLVPPVVRRGLVWSALASVLGGLVLGTVAAGYYLLRDERPWLAPAVVVAALAGMASWKRTRADLLRFAGVALGGLVVAAMTLSLCLTWVVHRNEHHYGTSVISDLVDGDIARAYAQWQRVLAGEEVDYVPVNRAQREAVYEISTEAAELGAVLEDPENRWLQNCVEPGCDYRGAFFVWAIRDAAHETGRMTSGREAQQFFGEIADDIEAACAEQLDCSPSGLGPLPPWFRVDPGRIWNSSVGVVQSLLSYDVGEPERAFPSGGIDPSWDTMLRPIRGITPRDQDAYAASEARAMDRQEAVSALTDLYRWAGRLAVVPAIIGLGIGAATRVGRRRPAALLTCAAMLTAVVSRVVLLGVIDATSFAARGGAYIIPAVDFLLVFLVLGVWSLVTVARTRWTAQSAPASSEDAADPSDVRPEVVCESAPT